MNLNNYVFVLVYITIFTSVTCNFKVHYNTKLAGKAFRYLWDVHINRCSNACLARTKCMSFNYAGRIRFCELNAADATAIQLEAAPGYTFMAKSSMDKTARKYHCNPECKITEACELTNGAGQCVVNECPDPPVVLSTSIHGNLRHIGARIRYRCDVGYTMDAALTVTSSRCLKKGKWSDVNIACIASSPCGALSQPENGQLTYTSNKVTYTCNTGYTLSTELDTRTCGEENEWSGPSGTCRLIDCGPPESVVNGYYKYNATGNVTTYLSVVQYYCNTGYTKVSGNGRRKCNASGTWQGDVLICNIKDCGSPPSPINGHNTSQIVTTYDSQVQYECNIGYVKLNGTETIHCSENGVWRGRILNCKAVDCNSPPSPINGHNTSEIVTTYPSAVNYTCHIGYRWVSGSYNRLCTADGTWNGQTLTCAAKDCGTLTAPNNGYTTSPVVTTYPSQMTFNCSTGYVRSSGNYTRNCTAAGMWDGQKLICTAVDCGPPTAPINGHTTSLIVSTYPSQMTYNCNTGYVRYSGNYTRNCTAAGTWDGQTLNCTVVDCRFPPLPINGRITGQVPTTVTGQVPATTPGYRRKRAVDKSLEPTFTIWPTTTTYPSEIVFACNTGYNRTSGNYTRKCTDAGTWDGQTLNCTVVDCGIPREPINGFIYSRTTNTTYLNVMVFNCSHGYQRFSGSLNRTCTASGRWDGEIMNCTAVDCGQPPKPINGVIVGTMTATIFSSEAMFRCNTDYVQASGDLSRVCGADGNWNGTLLHCLPSACSPGWFRIEQSCYYTNSSLGTFSDSQDVCEKLYSHQVFIETELEKENLILNMIKLLTDCVHIGHMYNNATNQWVYYNSDRVANITYDLLRDYEFEGTDIHYLMFQPSNLMWSPDDGNRVCRYLCEKEIGIEP